ncbi:MAG: polyprenol monophosphomannose synthase [Fuerstiella sp.]|jgi:dolichol-phosphate mannosyltransferase|nr:polyprenol monophosphomannose synthase [Fuerstiella sp.]
MKRLLITVCTYNEVENIRLLIPELRSVAPHADILVIDDNSPDGTGAAVAALATADRQVRLLHRPAKTGLGGALLAGVRHAINNDYEQLLNLDADFSHSPAYIPDLLKTAETCDVAIGSRYVTGGGVVGWNLKRHVMSRAVNIYARLFLGLRTRDNSGSYRCYNVDKLREINWDLTVAHGYAFLEEVLFRCQQVGCTFGETPIVFEDRRFGVTKINWKEVAAAMWVILRLGLQRLAGP